MNLGSFKNVIKTMLNHIFKYTYKQNLALNNQQWLICNKIKPNQTNLELSHIWDK